MKSVNRKIRDLEDNVLKPIEPGSSRLHARARPSRFQGRWKEASCMDKNASQWQRELLYLQQQSQAGCKLIPNPISSPYLLIILILALCVFIIFLFLPSILELRRPKDPGPRKIAEATTEKDE